MVDACGYCISPSQQNLNLPNQRLTFRPLEAERITRTGHRGRKGRSPFETEKVPQFWEPSPHECTRFVYKVILGSDRCIRMETSWIWGHSSRHAIASCQHDPITSAIHSTEPRRRYRSSSLKSRTQGLTLCLTTTYHGNADRCHGLGLHHIQGLSLTNKEPDT